jgi:hypothetical protein
LSSRVGDFRNSCIEAADSERISAARSGASAPEIESIAAAATSEVANLWMVRRMEDGKATQVSTIIGLLQPIARSGFRNEHSAQPLNPANEPWRNVWANALQNRATAIKPGLGF